MKTTLKKTIKNLCKKIMKSKLMMKIIANLIYGYVHLIGKTTRWELNGVENFYKLWQDNQGVILLAWHGRVLMLPYFWNQEKQLNALVSLHRDGRMIAGLLERFGLGTIGGSTNENASGAAFELMRSLRNDISICVVPDGPRGPRMHMGRSPICFAQKTGKPIVAISYSVKNSFLINKAWDKMMIPLPFGKGVCTVTPPMFIPKDATEAELEQYRLEMEDILNQNSYECDIKVGLTPVLPDNNNGKTKRTETNNNVY